MEELVELFKGARRRIRLWKISACREGVREAWAMVKTRYTKLDPNHMARVGPLGSNGEEIPVSLVYDQVEVATKYSQQDCKLDCQLDGIEAEILSPSDYVLSSPCGILAELYIICHGRPFRLHLRALGCGVFLNTVMAE